MNKYRLFRVTQASEKALPYLVAGLSKCWSTTEFQYKFETEFDPKTGDYWAILTSDSEVPEKTIDTIINGTQEQRVE